MKTQYVKNFERRTSFERFGRTLLGNGFIFLIVGVILSLILNPILGIEKKELFETVAICAGLITLCVSLILKPDFN